ncbi:MAG: CDP-alcohol phosphatidyltransferase family protein [Candidatus Rokubacteria bacterium]|nr:CDP-alcohol phosphatidyltransferase family protein [Candidatus Rokubacteria bacterium]
MANALTGVRLLLIVPFAVLMARGDARSAILAALVLAAAIATDLLDGPVARRRGTATAASAAFDHTTDFLFVTSGLAAGAARGAFPWILPALVAVAFTQYVVDSYWLHRDRRLRASRLGRCNGILYFVPLAGDILVRWGLPALEPLLGIVVWGLVASTVLSITERLVLALPRRERLAGRAPEE